MKENSLYNWKRTDDYISVTRSVKKEKAQHTELIKRNNVDTVYKVWQNSVRTYGSKHCLGTRKISSVGIDTFHLHCSWTVLLCL